MKDPNMVELYTISQNKVCIVKSLPLEQSLEYLKEHLEAMDHDEEIDIHFWREN